jgi:N-methylhydantoinase A
MAWRIGTDSGGTFTDICLFEEQSGRVAVWKVSSTPSDPSHAVAEGVAEALVQVAAQASEVPYFGHGTTVATNALIQHRGALTGLITSDGFRDLLEIGRQKRPDLYDLQADKLPALIERRMRREVSERLLHDGRVETALDKAAVRDAAQVLRKAGAEAVAICFLYSFLDTARMRKQRGASSARNFPRLSSAPRTKWRPSFANTSGCRPPSSTPISGP